MSDKARAAASTEVAVVTAPPPHAATLFGTTDPAEIAVKATSVAAAVTNLIQSNGFATNIQGRSYVQVEGWNGLGGILGLGVRVDFVRPFVDLDGAPGYEAAVSIIDRAGDVVGSAQAICTRSEKRWRDPAKADAYALYSMAQTRATGKAYRSALSWIVKMAGFEATPAEEMPESPEETVARQAEAARFAETCEACSAWIKAGLDANPERGKWIGRRLATVLGEAPKVTTVVQRFGAHAATEAATLAEIARLEGLAGITPDPEPHPGDSTVPMSEASTSQGAEDDEPVEGEVIPPEQAARDDAMFGDQEATGA